jgi:uncharacterized protein YhfF
MMHTLNQRMAVALAACLLAASSAMAADANAPIEAEAFLDNPAAAPGTGTLLYLDGNVFDPLRIADGVLDLQGLPLGAHTLYLRFRDSAGVWSPAIGQTFFVADVASNANSPVTLVRAVGSVDGRRPTTLFADDGAFDDVVEVVTLRRPVGPGYHSVRISVLDSQGLWGDSTGVPPRLVAFDQIGVWRPSTGRFYLDIDDSRTWTSGIDVITASFGLPADRPVAGDWNGDGFDEVGMWRPSTGRFYLDIDGSRTWTRGVDVITDAFGIPTDRPVAGDWNGDGIDEIGMWRPSTGRFYLDIDGSRTWTRGVDVITASFGVPTDLPVAGDWNGDGVDEIGVWRPSTGRFYLDQDGSRTWTAGVDVITASFGVPTDLPVVGDWNGDGVDEIGVWRPSTGRFYLDQDGSRTWTAGVDVITASFGVPTDRPVAGRW